MRGQEDFPLVADEDYLIIVKNICGWHVTSKCFLNYLGDLLVILTFYSLGYSA
ncbi:MAG: hypothetical protein QGG79_00765 [Dehalococcoidales bacterium]|nr:hypothetical protein [Dehalococcoidales bacterium]